MNLFIKLDSPLGEDLGPYFTLTPTPSGPIDPSIVTKDQLLDGVYVNLGNPFTSAITITSIGKCKNSTTINVTPINICFAFNGESFGSYVCTLQPEQSLYNAKPYYKVLIDDCTTPWEAGTVYVYFNTAPGIYQNKWVIGILGNANNIIQYLDLDTPPTYPIGNIDPATPLSPPNNSGLWKIGNGNPSQVYITSSLFECPTPTTICFSFDGEAPGEHYICTLQPESGLANGRLYYKVLQPDCVTPVDYFTETLYVYFNTSVGIYQNKWVMGYLNDQSEIFQYLDLNIAPTYPIGNAEPLSTPPSPPNNSGLWRIGNIISITVSFGITSSVLECPEPVDICFTHTGESQPVVNCTISAEPGLKNGKVYYKAVTDDCVTQYSSGLLSLYYVWFSTSGTYTNQWVMSPLDDTINVNSYLPVSSSTDYPIGTWTAINTSENFVSNSALTCPPTTTTTTTI